MIRYAAGVLILVGGLYAALIVALGVTELRIGRHRRARAARRDRLTEDELAIELHHARQRAVARAAARARHEAEHRKDHR